MSQTQSVRVTPASVPLPPDPTPSHRGGHTGASQSHATTHSSSRGTYEILDKNHRLSSAGAAASLKYANPQDLPSFPSAGLKKSDSAAGAAASLGWANQKPFELWRPDSSASASAAAVLAHSGGAKVELWRAEATPWGNSAATQALKNAGTLSPQLDYGYTTIGRKGSLMAATGAMSTSRRRSESTPMPAKKVETYPDEANAVTNALRAANSAHRSKMRTGITPQGGSVPYSTMPREMYTSHPPIGPEVEEQNRQGVLHASAVTMAKQMYNLQQKQFDAASSAHQGAALAHGRQPSGSGVSDGDRPAHFANLQIQAQKLAQERLANLHDEHAQYREYRDYYGENQQQHPKSRLSIRGTMRRRASSDGDLDEDRKQSNTIRAQMSLFSSNLSQVDSKKRQHDREALIAAAQRNVAKNLQAIDERVMAETGRPSPSTISEWELKAQAAAQGRNDTRRMEHHNKVNIGGGKFIDQSEIDEIAARNVQPVLDEINDKVEKQQAKEADMRLEQELEKKRAEEQKIRDKEQKEIHRKLKQQDKEEEKARKAEEKHIRDEEKRMSKDVSSRLEHEHEKTKLEERKLHEMEEKEIHRKLKLQDKEEEKARKAEERALRKGKRRSLKTGEATEPEITEPAAAPVAIAPVAVAVPVETQGEPITSATLPERSEALVTPANADTSSPQRVTTAVDEWPSSVAKDEAALKSPKSGTSEDSSKMKNWLKTKIGRRLSRAHTPPNQAENQPADRTSGGKFIGGAALTGGSAKNSSTNLATDTASAKVTPLAAPAATPEAEEHQDRVGRSPVRRDHSPVSSPTSMYEDLVSHDNVSGVSPERGISGLTPPPKLPEPKSSSPARSTRFTEEI
ncbi:uncharacterized protein BP5553_01298 [Venustampulla echinocandica]|uniref:Eisosome protein 1 n=1 Tax=Venustampulla echinocandica TaxID=2656787 RepID=A0A370U0L8_9HELO|nr:uncharacterized protein BP5553_01298 [Venustampulla echinocandica]RDL41319.1 hypothetical protein BP5553_01298 [Venustampulla echinocandica]